MPTKDEQKEIDEKNRRKFNAGNISPEESDKENNKESDIVSSDKLKDLDEKHVFVEGKIKIRIMSRGKRTYHFEGKEKAANSIKSNCLSIKAPGTKDKDGNCSIDIPILTYVRFIEHTRKPEHEKFVMDIKKDEEELNAGQKDFKL